MTQEPKDRKPYTFHLCKNCRYGERDPRVKAVRFKYPSMLKNTIICSSDDVRERVGTRGSKIRFNINFGCWFWREKADLEAEPKSYFEWEKGPEREETP